MSVAPGSRGISCLSGAWPPVSASALAAALLLSTVPPLAAQWTGQPVPSPPTGDGALVEEGRQVYEQHCWYCHGEEGRGDGPVAAYLWPRPRSFYQATYRLRSTGSGYLPADEDLYRTVSRGMPGTAMPAWSSVLSARERWSVIAYVKTFASDLFESPYMSPDSAPVAVPDSPPVGVDSLVRWGRRVYRSSECGSCHGRSGRGAGSRADSLTDDLDRPVFPADLSFGWRFKGGSTPRDLYLRLSTGMDGTPMPSYRETLDDAERWALAQYVSNLERSTDSASVDRAVLRARSTGGELPTAPDDTAWRRAPTLHIPMTGQATFAPRWQVPAVRDLWVRALYDSTSVALRLTWHDPFPDTVPGPSGPERATGWEATDTYEVVRPDGLRSRDTFPDVAEVLYPTDPGTGRALPHFVYGDADRPVDVLRWSAAPGVGLDPGPGSLVGLRAAGVGERPAPRDLSGPEGASAAWTDGRWSVVIRLPRSEVLGPGGYLPVTFHIRDGHNQEVGLRMSVASWYFLYLEERAGSGTVLRVVLASLLSALSGAGLVWYLRRKQRRGELARYGVAPGGST